MTVVALRARVAEERSDAALFEAMADGDLGALGVLFDRHHAAVRQLLVRAAPRADDVDDLVQETFLAASRAAASFDGRASAAPFLAGVAAQLLRRRRRTFARLRRLAEAVGLAPSPAAPTPEDGASAREEHAALHAALARLPDDPRLAIVLSEWQGLSGPEIARALGVPTGTVWRWLHEARAELRRAMARAPR